MTSSSPAGRSAQRSTRSSIWGGRPPSSSRAWSTAGTASFRSGRTTSARTCRLRAARSSPCGCGSTTARTASSSRNPRRPRMGWTRKDLLTMRDLEAGEIVLLVDTAASLQEIAGREIKKVPALRGKTVANLFYESSTRTRPSFEIAGKWLSADVINFSASGSSTTKGESFIDTAKNIAAMSPDVVIVRHSSAGAAELLARTLPCSIVNAGDGAHEHPTQALLDLLTIREKKAHFDGLHVAIVGDIAHSRVARSDIHGMRKLGVTVTVAGPPTLIPPFVQELGVKVSYPLQRANRHADVSMLLRLRHERMTNGLIPSLREYSRYWGLTLDKLAKHARPDVLIMHPGPVNRGIELAPEVADGPYSVILDQVAKGVAVRMGVLLLLAGSKADAP